MKKTLKAITLSSIIALIMLANFAIIASAAVPIDNSQIPLEQRLIGTWRWTNQHSWIIVFREDGTMLDGGPGLRTIYNWMVVNDRLFVNGVDWNIRITDSTITVERYGRSTNTNTYVWYSDSTDGETSMWFMAIILIVILAAIAGIVVGIVLLCTRKSRRANRLARQQMQHNNSQPPNDLHYGGE